MDIAAYANTMRTEYQSVLQGLQNGTVSSKDALDYHYAEAQKTRGLSATGVGMSLMEYGRVRTDIPAEMIDKIQQVLAKSDHRVAAQTYQNSGGDSMTGSVGISSDEPKTNHIANGYLDQFRNEYRAESDNFLGEYVNTHNAEWKSAAQELGYDISGMNHLMQFYDAPELVGHDVSKGTPKSKAEDIFRHIASSSDIAQFESVMAPHQDALDAKVYDYVTGLMNNTSGALDRFAPYVKDMEAAGITPDDLSRTLLSLNKEGEYFGAGNSERGAKVARFVNENAGVRALFDVHADRIQNDFNRVHKDRA